MENMTNEKEVLINHEMKRFHDFESNLKGIFNEIDLDGDGIMTFDEFETFLTSERAKAGFRILGIDIAESRAIFRLLDISNDGKLGIDEFVMGCFRVNGPAKMLDTAQ